jgi:DNA-binding response OmpR family regulator
MMPGMSGPDLCRKIRDVKRDEYTYLIILTAVTKQQGYIQGMSAGADDFVSKPVDFSELTIRVRVARRILALQRERRHLEGLLPICPKCKKIQATKEGWEPVESYISKRSEAQFSHGICPNCYTTIVQPQLAALRRRNQTQGA